MDQHISGELPSLESEKSFERHAEPGGEAKTGSERTEFEASAAIEKAAPTAPPAMPPQAAHQPAPQQNTGSALPVSDDNGNPVIADDTDLIEKEWVLKAKEIVARTRTDPYQQNKEVERMKADYMKKRYNKDIRITEE